ncbi:MAG: metal-dependent hydrolase [Thermomicrobiales bacterium]|nr:metal-dependent hydrolase [Thermomicrobiales bacterium]
MRRLTHLAVATLGVMPLAVDHAWPAASGIVLLGMAGAVVPDYLDLRSDLRGVLTHRGLSHSVLIAGLSIALVWVLLGALSRLDDPAWALDSGLIAPLTAAFAIGVVSHLILDACTPRGLRPLLPLSQWRLWLLPKPFRIGTGGRLDNMIGLAAFGGAVAVVVLSVASS